MQRRGIVELLVLLVGTGCGDDDVGSTASGSETEASSTGASATSPTTSISESATTTGTETEGTDAEPTDTDPSSSSESSSSRGEPNEPPDAADDEYVVFLSAMPLSIDDASGLFANDIDPDDDTLTVSALDDPSSLGVVVDVQGSGAFTYGDGPWWGGPDAFGYTI